MIYLLLLLLTYLAFLFPIAIYCLVLAMVNRRSQPTMISGVWDFIGLLLACSGFLLVSGPAIIATFFKRHIDRPFAAEPNQIQSLADIFDSWTIVLVCYFAVILMGAALLLLSRRNKTVIYNVDQDLFDQVFGRALQKLGLAQSRLGRRVLLEPLDLGPDQESQFSTSPLAPLRADGRVRGNRHGGLLVDAFPALSNVTMHWQHGSEELRHDVEGELRRTLDECRALDNPAGSWFLGVGTMILGVVFLVVAFVVLMMYFPPRRW